MNLNSYDGDMAVKPTSIKCLVKDCGCEAYWQSDKRTSSKCFHKWDDNEGNEIKCKDDYNKHIICNEEECNCKKYKKPTDPVHELPCKGCNHIIDSHVMTKKEGVKAIPKYIVPKECFYLYWNYHRGWQPCGAFGCAHFVAHPLDITHSGADGNKCQKGFVVRNDELIMGLQEKNVNNVAVKDIWFKASSGIYGHSGWVSAINPIKIKHLPAGGDPSETTYGEGRISGGKFYGDPWTTRYLANLNRSDPSRKPEVHDLTNIKGGSKCQIDEIKASKYYSSKEKALSDGFDPCAYCMRGSTK